MSTTQTTLKFFDRLTEENVDPLLLKLVKEELPITRYVWESKYRWTQPDGTPLESTRQETNARIVRGTFAQDEQALLYGPIAEAALNLYLSNPGGRIHAGAGTGKAVTLGNCYVSGTIGDNLVSIQERILEAALTQQQGGGIGSDYSTIRPNRAVVRRTGSVSSGTIPFARQQDAMCDTIMSSGSRRGAMMLVLSIRHPDVYRPEFHTREGKLQFQEALAKLKSGEIRKASEIPVDFITAKQVPGQLTNFNVSIGVHQDFMEKALPENLDWDLVFDVPPADPSRIIDSYQKDGVTYYVYARVKAADLWDEVIKATYDFAEPGVLFVDRVNEWNNLWYCETISATNPCGEQPLPPNGMCDLAAVNYAMMVKRPFTPEAYFDFELLDQTAWITQRLLDNVLDVTSYPLEAQREESMAKRRVGQGFLGLGTALKMLGVRYGSTESLRATEEIVKAHRNSVYQASIDLAKERGPFPLFDRDKYLKGKYIQQLPKYLREQIAEYGIRNGVNQTVAPTGNTSIYYHNPSSGVEDSFSFDYERNVLVAPGQRERMRVEDFGWRAYKAVHGLDPETKPKDVKLPDFMSTALELTVEDHLQIMAVVQKYIDASISKTINIPPDMPFDQFKAVYTRAYELGLKGCTTYRPSETRGSVLVQTDTQAKKEVTPKPEKKVSTRRVKERPFCLPGLTYKVKDDSNGNMFVTVNCDPDTRMPIEIFLRDNTGNPYVEHAGRTLSLLLRAGVPIKEIRQQLQRSGGTSSLWYSGRNFTSSLQLLDHVIFEQAMPYFQTVSDWLQLDTDNAGVPLPEVQEVAEPAPKTNGKPCPECGAATEKVEGCLKCTSCLYSKCG